MHRLSPYTQHKSTVQRLIYKANNEPIMHHNHQMPPNTQNMNHNSKNHSAMCIWALQCLNSPRTPNSALSDLDQLMISHMLHDMTPIPSHRIVSPYTGFSHNAKILQKSRDLLPEASNITMTLRFASESVLHHSTHQMSHNIYNDLIMDRLAPPCPGLAHHTKTCPITHR